MDKNKKKTKENSFSAYVIIQNKRDKLKLNKEEIEWFINGYTDGSIPDYQMSALLMAIYLNGMDTLETAALTDAMLYSGTVLNFNDPTVIDKHSTGGVGDKTSFILAPIAAACGVKVPMIAGRGLGHTGGTVDKIESIEGFNTSLNLEAFSKQLKENGIVLIGQTKDIAPADKKIYALRDVTGTIESIPLITASIMSKKLAEGASGIVMDIKTGPGAFMKTKTQARALAKSISSTALRFNKNIMTILTDMSQPLGHAIGNSLEIIESIETLKNKGPKDLTDISLELAGAMIYLAGITKTHSSGIKKAKQSIIDGSALEKFRELIKIQGGNPNIIEDYSLLPIAKNTLKVKSKQSGYITSIDGLKLGLQCVELGGGRKKSTDKIDFAVGFITHKKIGQKIMKDEDLITIYYHDMQKNIVDKLEKDIIENIFKIAKTKSKKNLPLIIEKQEKLSK